MKQHTSEVCMKSMKRMKALRTREMMLKIQLSGFLKIQPGILNCNIISLYF